MFREILSVLRKEDLLKQAMEDAQEMLSKAKLVFSAAIYRLTERKEPEINIYEKDKEINRTEWEIRRKVLQHLLIGSRKEDITAALILTSSVIDIERIGDYSKNIFELAEISPLAMVFDEKYADFFREIENQILEMFDLTGDSYREGDAQKAQRVLDTHWRISKRCDVMLEDLASEEKLSAELAVIYTLFARYLKRVSSHLKNVASSVVSPFPKMGFIPSTEDGEVDVE